MLAINNLKDQNYDQAIELLRKSELLSENNEQGLAMTYNNLACYYRKLGHLRSALIYLEKALDIESKST
jgi:tetratricopeptide (TPR) repeat protein